MDIGRKTKTIAVDVMVNNGNSFYKTVNYPMTFPLCGKALLEDIKSYILEQLPSLKGRKGGRDSY